MELLITIRAHVVAWTTHPIFNAERIYWKYFSRRPKREGRHWSFYVYRVQGHVLPRQKPRVYGIIPNYKPPAIDPTNLIYQAEDRQICLDPPYEQTKKAAPLPRE